MKLTHLGASYTPSTSTIETIKTDTELRFLGRSYRMRTHRAAQSRALDNDLTYRGVRYKA